MGDRYYSQQSPGQIVVNPTPITTNITLTGYESTYLLFNTTAGPINVTLPPAASFPSKLYYFSNQSGNTENQLYISGNGSDTIQSQNQDFVNQIYVQCNAGGYGLISGGSANVWYPMQGTWVAPNSPSGNNAVATLDSSGNPETVGTFDSFTPLGSNSGGMITWQYGFLAVNPITWTSGVTNLTGSEQSYNLIDGTGGIVTLNLPTNVDGKVYYFNNLLGSTEAVIQPTSTDTFQDGTTAKFIAPGAVLGLMYSYPNTTWYFLTSAQNAELNMYLAAENIAAGALINVEGIAGTAEVRNASATNSYRAQGFALAAITSGQTGPVNVGSGTITSLSGLTPGGLAFLGDTGHITAVVPGTGKLLQQVGYAETTSIFQFWPGPIVQR